MRVIASGLLVGLLSLLHLPAYAGPADDFPNRPITITNLYAAGGGIDLMARVIGQQLTEKWKVPVLVDSKPGAGGTIAAGFVSRQPPDGYSLFITDVSYSIVPSIYTKLTYDPIKDLAPVIMTNTVTQAVTINPSLPVKTLADLIAYAKANPGKLSYASAGIGSLPHLAPEMIKKATNIDIAHIPYRGAVPAMTDVVAGRVNMYVGALATPLPQIKEGQLRAIAVMQNTRSPLLPDVPSIVEAGYPELVFEAYYGIFAPAATPRPIIDKLAAAMREALSTPEVKKTMLQLGNEVSGLGPDEFAAFLKKDFETWQKAAQFAGVKPN